MESSRCTAEIAQLGERQTEDLKVPGSIPGRGILINNFVYDSLSFMSTKSLNQARLKKKNMSEGGFEPPPT